MATRTEGTATVAITGPEGTRTATCSMAGEAVPREMKVFFKEKDGVVTAEVSAVFQPGGQVRSRISADVWKQFVGGIRALDNELRRVGLVE